MARHHNGFIHRRRDRLAPSGFDSPAFRLLFQLYPILYPPSSGLVALRRLRQLKEFGLRP